MFSSTAFCGVLVASAGGIVSSLEEPVTIIASMDEIVPPPLIAIMNIPSSGGTVGGAGLEEPVTIIPGMHEIIPPCTPNSHYEHT